VIVVGLDYLVGSGGARLSPSQRQKVALARAALKRPDLLALNEATAVLDPASEARILDQLKGEFAGRSIVASLSRPSLGRAFDRVLVMDQGRLVDEGAYETLSQPDGPLAPLMAAE
jgi:ABC-type multidrug transport system fused ATPase/permease subunit